MRVNDAILGMIVIVFSGLVIWEARSYPALPGVPYGPGLFPTVVAGAMIFGGLVLLVKGLGNRKRTGWVALDQWARKPRTYGTLGLIFGSLLFYILFSERLGFLITSFLILMALLLWTRRGRRVWSTSIIAVFFPLLVFFLFSEMLRIPLPPGPLVGLF
jgi:putative tricarboxylic transport membrane protein